MKISTSTIKQTARGTLIGHWNEHIAFSAALIGLELIAVWIVNLFAVTGTATAFIFRIVVAAILQVLLGLFAAGAKRHFLRSLRGEASPLADLLVPLMKQPDRYLIVGLVQIAAGFLCFAPLLLVSLFRFPNAYVTLAVLIVLSIFGIAAYAAVRATIAPAWFLLLDDESLSAGAALKKSAALMRGRVWDLIRLALSFIGYVLLAFLTFGIGFVWVLPYYYTSLAGFYEELCKQI